MHNMIICSMVRFLAVHSTCPSHPILNSSAVSAKIVYLTTTLPTVYHLNSKLIEFPMWSFTQSLVFNLFKYWHFCQVLCFQVQNKIYVTRVDSYKQCECHPSLIQIKFYIVNMFIPYHLQNFCLTIILVCKAVLYMLCGNVFGLTSHMS